MPSTLMQRRHCRWERELRWKRRWWKKEHQLNTHTHTHQIHQHDPLWSKESCMRILHTQKLSLHTRNKKRTNENTKWRSDLSSCSTQRRREEKKHYIKTFTHEEVDGSERRGGKKGTLLAWEVTEKKNDVHLFVLIYFSWLRWKQSKAKEEKTSMKWKKSIKKYTAEEQLRIISNHISFSFSFSHHFHFFRYYLSIDLKYRRKRKTLKRPYHTDPQTFYRMRFERCMHDERQQQQQKSYKLDHWFFTTPALFKWVRRKAAPMGINSSSSIRAFKAWRFSAVLCYFPNFFTLI